MGQYLLLCSFPSGCPWLQWASQAESEWPSLPHCSSYRRISYLRTQQLWTDLWSKVQQPFNSLPTTYSMHFVPKWTFSLDSAPPDKLVVSLRCCASPSTCWWTGFSFTTAHLQVHCMPPLPTSAWTLFCVHDCVNAGLPWLVEGVFRMVSVFSLALWITIAVKESVKERKVKVQ